MPNPALRRVWVDPASFATTLLAVYVDAYGTKPDPDDPDDPGPFGWHPATIMMTLEEDFGVDLPQESLDKLMAAIELHVSDSFWQKAPDFVRICNVLSGDVFDPELWNPADVEECAWGVTEAALLVPSEEGEEFSSDVLGYIKHALDSEGFIRPPQILDMLQDEAEPETASQLLDYSDDPVMFAGVWGMQNNKTKAVDDVVRSRLQLLGSQLEDLPLKAGNSRGVIQRLLKKLTQPN